MLVVRWAQKYFLAEEKLESCSANDEKVLKISVYRNLVGTQFYRLRHEVAVPVQVFYWTIIVPNSSNTVLCKNVILAVHGVELLARTLCQLD